jgi:hypothetical protein
MLNLHSIACVAMQATQLRVTCNQAKDSPNTVERKRE